MGAAILAWKRTVADSYVTLESPADWVADGLPSKIPEWEEIGNTARAFGQRAVLDKIALVKTRVVIEYNTILMCLRLPVI